MFCPKCGTENKNNASSCSSCGSELKVSSPVTPQPAIIDYAGFWKRAVAYLIDVIIIVVGAIIIGVVGAIIGIDLISESAPTMRSVIVNVVSWIYFALMESSSKQATLGKIALGIIVTDLNGNRISLGRANGRYWGKLVSAIILCIGFIMAGFTKKKQALHDMMAGTLVVRKSPQKTVVMEKGEKPSEAGAQSRNLALNHQVVKKDIKSTEQGINKKNNNANTIIIAGGLIVLGILIIVVLSNIPPTPPKNTVGYTTLTPPAQTPGSRQEAARQAVWQAALEHGRKAGLAIDDPTKPDLSLYEAAERNLPPELQHKGATPEVLAWMVSWVKERLPVTAPPPTIPVPTIGQGAIAPPAPSGEAQPQAKTPPAPYDYKMERALASLGKSQPPPPPPTTTGIAFMEKGEYQQAIIEFSKSIDIEPLCETYNYRGEAYFKLGKYQKAREDFNRAIIAFNQGEVLDITFIPGFGGEHLGVKGRDFVAYEAQFYRNRGLAYEKLGNQNQAIEDMKTAAKGGDKEAQKYLLSKEIGW